MQSLANPSSEVIKDDLPVKDQVDLSHFLYTTNPQVYKSKILKLEDPKPNDTLLTHRCALLVFWTQLQHLVFDNFDKKGPLSGNDIVVLQHAFTHSTQFPFDLYQQEIAMLGDSSLTFSLMRSSLSAGLKANKIQNLRSSYTTDKWLRGRITELFRVAGFPNPKDLILTQDQIGAKCLATTMEAMLGFCLMMERFDELNSLTAFILSPTDIDLPTPHPQNFMVEQLKEHFIKTEIKDSKPLNDRDDLDVFYAMACSQLRKSMFYYNQGPKGRLPLPSWFHQQINDRMSTIHFSTVKHYLKAAVVSHLWHTGQAKLFSILPHDAPPFIGDHANGKYNYLFKIFSFLDSAIDLPEMFFNEFQKQIRHFLALYALNTRRTEVFVNMLDKMHFDTDESIEEIAGAHKTPPEIFRPQGNTQKVYNQLATDTLWHKITPLEKRHFVIDLFHFFTYAPTIEWALEYGHVLYTDEETQPEPKQVNWSLILCEAETSSMLQFFDERHREDQFSI
jgi:hypothetical protein